MSDSVWTKTYDWSLYKNWIKKEESRTFILFIRVTPVYPMLVPEPVGILSSEGRGHPDGNIQDQEPSVNKSSDNLHSVKYFVSFGTDEDWIYNRLLCPPDPGGSSGVRPRVYECERFLSSRRIEVPTSHSRLPSTDLKKKKNFSYYVNLIDTTTLVYYLLG